MDSVSPPYRLAAHEWPSSWTVTLTNRPTAAAIPMSHASTGRKTSNETLIGMPQIVATL